MPIIDLQNISVQFGENTVLQNISFSINTGEYIGLIGPNGAGKSTLLKVILGMIIPTKGSIETKENVVFGYVPQNYFLSTSFTISVQEVLEMASSSLSFWRTQAFHNTVIESLEKVGLDKSILEKNFQSLSGGQKQRVIIARSLIINPDILLFDEPLSGVDFETKIQIYDLLAYLNKTYATTIIFVSHEIESIISKCHRVICLDKTMHLGCHPMDFAKGKIENCPIIKTEKTTSKKIVPIHHHHSLTPQ